VRSRAFLHSYPSTTHARRDTTRTDRRRFDGAGVTSSNSISPNFHSASRCARRASGFPTSITELVSEFRSDTVAQRSIAPRSLARRREITATAHQKYRLVAWSRVYFEDSSRFIIRGAHRRACVIIFPWKRLQDINKSAESSCIDCYREIL